MVVKLSKGNTMEEKYMYARNALQLAINRIYDSDLKSYSEINAPSGLRQVCIIFKSGTKTVNYY